MQEGGAMGIYVYVYVSKKFLNIFIGVKLLYNGVLVSAV